MDGVTTSVPTSPLRWSRNNWNFQGLQGGTSQKFDHCGDLGGADDM